MSVLSALRSLARNTIGRLLFTIPDDGAALWTPEPDPDLPRRVDVLRVGDCEWREVGRTHTITGGVGYPLHMQRELAAQGIGLGWQNIFAWNYSDLPDARTMRKRRRAYRADPDIVLVGVGMQYAARHVFPFSRRMTGLRENLGRYTGPFQPAIWRVIAVGLRIFGHNVPFDTPENVVWFVAQIRSVWPDAQIMIQEPLMEQAFRGQLDKHRLEQARDDLLALCEQLEDVEWLPAPRLGTDRRLYGCNGANLNGRGSELAGKFYANWMIDNGYIYGAEPVSAQSTSAAPQT
jgi:hypothetical protein